ncbi:phosphate acyltransferase PlsX, partial [Bilophila sp.]
MSSNKTVIAVDAMGGDLGPSVVVPGAIEAARQTGAKILLVGNEATLDGELNRLSPSGVDLEIVHAPEVAGMDEKPSDILRRKKNASIQVACRLVRDGAAQGVVSAGHSGASVACGMFIMGRIPGVERPALASLLPTEKEPVVLLDVGATVDCKPYNIFQFGLMGDAFARDILNKEAPRVGLLSIGEEEGKGNSQVKEAYELFKMAQNLNFSGNIEGRDLFTGDVDVAVCDGFVGNVALKLSEGLGLSLSRVLKRE